MWGTPSDLKAKGQLRWSGDTCAFANVFQSPTGAKVQVVEANRLLSRIGEIERRTWDDVVNVPLAIVGPRHPWGKLLFDMFAKFGYRSAGEIKRGLISDTFPMPKNVT